MSIGEIIFLIIGIILIYLFFGFLVGFITNIIRDFNLSSNASGFIMLIWPFYTIYLIYKGIVIFINWLMSINFSETLKELK